MKWANYLMAALFVFGAAVQLNDPDPLWWVVIYLAAAAVCTLVARGILHLAPPIIVAAACALWSLSLAPSVVAKVPFLDMFSAWEMRDVGIEQSREMYGLLIIALWMIVDAVYIFKRRRSTLAEK